MARRNPEDDAGEPTGRLRAVRLVPDYGGKYLWNLSAGPSDDYALEPHDLGLSRRFGGSGGTGGQGWYQQGLRLARGLQKELGPDVEVAYWDARGEERPISELPGR